MTKARPQFWTLMTDQNGEAFSWSRGICSLIVVIAMLWGTYIVYHTRAIPDFTSVSLLIGAVYGVNRLGEAWERKPSAPPSPPPGPSTQTNVTVEGDR